MGGKLSKLKRDIKRSEDKIMPVERKLTKHSWRCYYSPIYDEQEYSVEDLKKSIDEYTAYLEEFKKEHQDHTDFKIVMSMEYEEYSSSDDKHIEWHITATGPMTDKELKAEEAAQQRQLQYKKQQYEQLKKEFGDK